MRRLALLLLVAGSVRASITLQPERAVDPSAPGANQQLPAIAAGEKSALVTWISEQRLYAAVVDADGNAGPAHAISEEYDRVVVSLVASDGRRYLVVWKNAYALKGLFVDAAGEPEGRAFVIASPGWFSVRYIASTYWIAWSDSAGLVAATIDGTGHVDRKMTIAGPASVGRIANSFEPRILFYAWTSDRYTIESTLPPGGEQGPVIAWAPLSCLGSGCGSVVIADVAWIGRGYVALLIMGGGPGRSVGFVAQRLDVRGEPVGPMRVVGSGSYSYGNDAALVPLAASTLLLERQGNVALDARELFDDLTTSAVVGIAGTGTDSLPGGPAAVAITPTRALVAYTRHLKWYGSSDNPERLFVRAIDVVKVPRGRSAGR